METVMTPEFWIAVGQIILLDLVLGGDNAVVIALACRKLPPEMRRKGILWGTAGAIGLRVLLIVFAMELLELPFIKLVGGVLLVWIGVKLLVPDHDGHGNISGSDRLLGAIKTIIVADLVMSVDNVLAIAAAAKNAGGAHQLPLVIFGLLVSIPIIIWGSQLVIKMMDRFPIIITIGAMLLGYLAGSMIVSDPAIADPKVVPEMPKYQASELAKHLWGAAGAVFVVLVGKLLAARAPKPE